MALPKLKEPPLIRKLPDDTDRLYQWMLEIHQAIYGLGESDTGSLDTNNLSSTIPISTGNQTISGIWTFTTHPLGLDHTKISNIGTNTHVVVDAHLADTTIHNTIEQIQDNLSSFMTAGNAVTLTYDDAANTLTVSITQLATVADAATQDLTGADTVDKTKLEADLTSCKTAINLILDRLQALSLIA